MAKKSRVYYYPDLNDGAAWVLWWNVYIGLAYAFLLGRLALVDPEGFAGFFTSFHGLPLEEKIGGVLVLLISTLAIAGGIASSWFLWVNKWREIRLQRHQREQLRLLQEAETR